MNHDWCKTLIFWQCSVLQSLVLTWKALSEELGTSLGSRNSSDFNAFQWQLQTLVHASNQSHECLVLLLNCQEVRCFGAPCSFSRWLLGMSSRILGPDPILVLIKYCRRPADCGVKLGSWNKQIFLLNLLTRKKVLH